MDYYPFGMVMPGRSYSTPGYRYGFNGQEKDDEINGSGNSMTAEYWQYDSRIGRRWNIDPRPNMSESPFSCFKNNPIVFEDYYGDTTHFYSMGKGNRQLGTINDDGPNRYVKVCETQYKKFRQMGQAIGTTAYEAGRMTDHKQYNNFLANYIINGISSIETQTGINYIAVSNGISMTFTGTSNPSSDVGISSKSAKDQYSTGTLTTNILFDDQSIMKYSEISAISGPWGNGSLPNGTYTASSIVATNEQGMVDDGVGFKVYLSDDPLSGRDGFRIHPDQRPEIGTKGCIGLVGSKAQLIMFKKFVSNYFKAYKEGTFEVDVNITNNPNYGRGNETNANE